MVAPRATATTCSLTLQNCLMITTSTNTGHLGSQFLIYMVRNIKLSWGIHLFRILENLQISQTDLFLDSALKKVVIDRKF